MINIYTIKGASGASVVGHRRRRQGASIETVYLSSMSGPDALMLPVSDPKLLIKAVHLQGGLSYP